MADHASDQDLESTPGHERAVGVSMDELQAALALDDESERAEAVQRFIEAAPPEFRFPDDLLPRLLSLDPGRGTRTAVIDAAVRRLAPEQLERALPHIAEQSNEKVWVWDLGAVTPWLPPSALPLALEIAEKIRYEAARGYALEAIVPALPRELQQRAIESALQLQSVAGRVSTVASMLERAPAAASDDALEALVSSLPEIESAESRARCTAEVVTALARSGRPDRAQVLMVEADELLARIPPERDPSFSAIVLHQARGDVLEARGEHEGAITAYQEALATVERTQQSALAPALLLRLGKSYKSANRLDEATATLSRALESDPSFYLELETRRELWQVHRRAGRWAAAALEERRVRAMGREVGARPEFDLSRTLTPDLPSAKDELGFEPLADALADMLNDPKTRLPLTIALTAPWGGGKSSLMQQLEQRLRSGGGRRASTRGAARRWFTIRFDAWKFHQSEQIWASLAKEIYRQAQRDFSLRQKLAFRARLEWSRGTLQIDLLLAGVMVAASIIAGIVLSSVKGGLAEMAPLVGAVTGLAGTVAIMFARHGRDLANPFQRAVDRHQARQQAYRAALGVTAEAAADVDALTESLTRNPSTAIAVLVDDLDRCSSGHVVAVVETINQIFNTRADRRCAFVLGIDRDVIAASLEHEYEGVVKCLDRHNPGLARRFGESFLEKIAQITVAIPEPSLEGLNRLLSSITGNVLPAQSAVDEAAIQRAVTLFQAAPLSNPIEVEQRRADVERRIPDVSAGAIREAMRRVRTSLLNTDSIDVARAEFALLQHLPRNPRTVKRFDNAFRLQLLVANNTPGCELDFRYEEIEALGRWIALRFGWPDLAGILDRRPSLLVKLDQLANGEPVSDQSDLGAWKGDERLLALLKVERADARVSRLPFQSFVNIR